MARRWRWVALRGVWETARHRYALTQEQRLPRIRDDGTRGTSAALALPPRLLVPSVSDVHFADVAAAAARRCRESAVTLVQRLVPLKSSTPRDASPRIWSLENDRRFAFLSPPLTMPIKRSPEETSRPPLSRGRSVVPVLCLSRRHSALTAAVHLDSACHRCFSRKVRCSGQPAPGSGVFACTSCLRTGAFRLHGSHRRRVSLIWILSARCEQHGSRVTSSRRPGVRSTAKGSAVKRVDLQ